MKQPLPLEPGRVAVSLAGRDKGTAYVVLAAEGERILLADGSRRPLDHPKKKNAKHLHAKPVILEGVQRALSEGGRLCDQQVREQLRAAGFAEDT